MILLRTAPARHALPAHLGRDGLRRVRVSTVGALVKGWVDSNKENHRCYGYWEKVIATAAKSVCDDRTVREARAEYYTLTGEVSGRH